MCFPASSTAHGDQDHTMRDGNRPDTLRGPGKMIDNGHGAGSHRRRSKKSNAGRIGFAGALVGALGIVVVAVVIIFLRPGRHDAPSPVSAGAGQDVSAGSSGGAKAVAAPKTGPTLSIANTDGYDYTIAAARGGTNNKPLPGTGTPPPDGAGYAYADYVLTNTGQKPALLDFPADLFVQRTGVAGGAQARCMPQPGTLPDMCTLPNHSAIIGYLNGSRGPSTQDGDQYMPAGASYLIRVATDLPVRTDLGQSQMNLYIWDARYISDRKAVLVAFP
jgi:hypothetical protein